MPGILPRFVSLFSRGFEWFALLVASMCASVRLLPQNHPYLQQANYGAYGVRNVLSEAYRNLVWDRKHLDQIAIFGVICLAVLLLVTQFIGLVAMAMLGASQASVLFTTPNPETDAAFMMLDYVFGIPGIYGSCALGEPTTPTHIAPCNGIPAFGAAIEQPFHLGLHSILEFYSWSLLFVAIIIFLYFVMVVVSETATTGVPFGARFNTIWGPIRMLVAIGLLLPVAYGLNSGQYIVLGVAKMGSNLATNGWLQYNAVVNGADGYTNPNPVGEDAQGNGGNAALIPRPHLPDISPFVAAMQLVNTCRVAYKKMYDIDINPYLVKSGAAAVPVVVGLTFENALAFYDLGNIRVRFGARVGGAGGGGAAAVEDRFPGGIRPYCGDITIPVIVKTALENGGGAPAGAWNTQMVYYNTVITLLGSGVYQAHAARWAEVSLVPNNMGGPDSGLAKPCNIPNASLMAGVDADFTYEAWVMDVPQVAVVPACNRLPTSEQTISLFTAREATLSAQINVSWQRLLNSNVYGVTDEILEYGWAGAGIWYNKIAGVIGLEMDAVTNLPFLSLAPEIMEEVKTLKGMQDRQTPGLEQYNPVVSDNTSIRERLGGIRFDMAGLFYDVYKSWSDQAVGVGDLSAFGEDNILKKIMHTIFGTRNLVSILEEENRDVHPMATLTAIGKDLVNSTLVSIAGSTILAVAGGIQGAGGLSYSQGVSQAASGALSSIALVGLTAGFVLFYVLPFMPFVYFFFAVGAWVKTIFEAMVGVPLWALAHMRIDKEGLPGDAAANGYFLILEIMIRPILCIFGLIASFIIFGALGRILHEIFRLATANVVGFDDPNMDVIPGVDLQFRRDIIDQFFFTILYTFIIYTLGLTCFKLIDLIPDSILRWSGAGVKSFGDYYQDPAEGLSSYAATGGYIVGARATSGIRQMGEAAGSGLGAAMGRERASQFGYNFILPDEARVIEANRTPAPAAPNNPNNPPPATTPNTRGTGTGRGTGQAPQPSVGGSGTGGNNNGNNGRGSSGGSNNSGRGPF